jgi:ADP-ribosyl-[dinitrogen reductase] hydrolase
VNQALVALVAGGTIAEALAAAPAGIPVDEVREAVERAPGLRETDVPSGGFVLDSVTAAFWALANHDGLEETIVAAVMLGGDADTTGAVAGALAGAHYGAGAIPTRWLGLLQPRAELESLADRLLEQAESATHRL